MSILKRIITFIVLTLLLSCTKKESNRNSSNLFNYLPNNPSTIIKSSSLDNLKEFITNNEAISRFKKTNTYSKLASQFLFANELSQTNELVIGFSEIGKNQEFLLVTKKDNDKLKRVNKIEYNKETYFKTNRNNFILDIDSLTIVSSSELLIENLIRNRESNIFYNNNSLNKLEKINDSEHLSVYINLENAPDFLNPVLPFSFLSSKDWLSLAFNKNEINGTATNKIIKSAFANAISNSENKSSSLKKIIPFNSNNYSSYTFNNLIEFDSQFENFSSLIKDSDELISFDVNSFKSNSF